MAQLRWGLIPQLFKIKHGRCNASEKIRALKKTYERMGTGFGRSDFWDCWVDER